MEQIEGRELLTGVDWDPACVERAKVRFAGRAAVEIRQMDVQQPEFLALRELNLSTVLFVNCLEMVEDGRLALQQAAAILQPRGRVVILAAALPELTGALDHAVLQHRYSRADLDSLLAACGLQILELKYVNLLGALAWWWDSQVLKRRAVPHSTYRMRDLAVPVARLLDRLTDLRSAAHCWP